MNKAFERCFVVSIVYTLRSVPYKYRSKQPFDKSFFSELLHKLYYFRLYTE